MQADDLCYMSAGDLASAIRTRRLSPIEVMEGSNCPRRPIKRAMAPQRVDVNHGLERVDVRLEVVEAVESWPPGGHARRDPGHAAQPVGEEPIGPPLDPLGDLRVGRAARRWVVLDPAVPRWVLSRSARRTPVESRSIVRRDRTGSCPGRTGGEPTAVHRSSTRNIARRAWR